MPRSAAILYRRILRRPGGRGFARRAARNGSRRFFREGIAQPDKLAGLDRALSASLPLRKTSESPILLFFACLLHAEADLAGAMRRTDLYQRMRRRLFLGEWRGMRQRPEWADGKVREARVTAWLCEIALALFRAALEAKTFPLAAWDAAVASSAAAAVASSVTPPVAADTLLRDLDQCGFIVHAGWSEGDQPHYSFPHRSILAYLAGAALAKRPPKEWLAEAIGHLWFQPAWEDVLLFLAGHLDEAGMDALLSAVENEPEDMFRQRLCWQWSWRARLRPLRPCSRRA